MRVGHIEVWRQHRGRVVCCVAAAGADEAAARHQRAYMGRGRRVPAHRGACMHHMIGSLMTRTVVEQDSATCVAVASKDVAILIVVPYSSMVQLSTVSPHWFIAACIGCCQCSATVAELSREGCESCLAEGRAYACHTTAIQQGAHAARAAHVG